jgi:hypothetical protein
MNTAEEARRFSIAVTGIDGIDLATEREVEVPPATTRSISTGVRVPGDTGKKGSNRIFFEVRAVQHDDVFVREKASFLVP